MPEPRRKRGRERVYDAERTREAILGAAEAVFAEHGFDGTSVGAIAAEAGYNKSLLFQYFGDKLGLYTQVLKRADREMGELLARVFASGLSDETVALQTHQFRAFLATMVQTLFDYLLEHPRFMRMLTWEMAEGWQTYAKITQLLKIDDINQFEMFFQPMQSAGLLRSGLNPILQLTMIMQICQSYLASLPLYQMILPGEDVSSAAALARGREYIIDFVVHGIMVDTSKKKL